MMNNLLKTAIVTLSLIYTPVTSAAPINKSDEERICDVLKIAEVVETFKQVNGHYPYEEAFLEPPENGYVAVPGMVNLYRGELPERYQYPPPGMSGFIDSLENFETYLSDGLQKDIQLPVDGRVVDEDQIPTFYQFMFNESAYFISAMLENPHPDARTIKPGYHKYQVSSTAAPSHKIKSYESAKKDCPNTTVSMPVVGTE